MSDQVFGIDLGTTNSCLAVMKDGAPRVVDIDGSPIVPSVVSASERGEMIVGARARNRRALYPEATVASIKRRMGSTERVRLGDLELLPEEIAAEILRHLKLEGERSLGCEVRRAVITVPAYFEDAQRRATIRAGELAGLEVVRLVNEPTAAALVYQRMTNRAVNAAGPAAVTLRSSPLEDRQLVLVYDLGGGTFDVSVVSISGDLFEVCASCGDTHLGGDDFDELLAEHLLAALPEKAGSRVAGDSRARARLRDAAERAKIELSTGPYARVMEEALARGVDLDQEVAREDLEHLLEKYLERTLREVDRALSEARVAGRDLSRVLLVGGSTRIPAITARLEAHLGLPAEHSLDADLCVALGAAVQGAIISGDVLDHIVVDVSAHSLGVKTADRVPGDSVLSLVHGEADHFSPILPRNTKIPTRRSEVYYTMVPDQEVVSVQVFQGEARRCSENTFIGKFMFDLEPAPVDSPVVMELGYDLDGIVHVVILQKGTDNRKEATLSARRDQPVGEVAAEVADNFILRKARDAEAGLDEGDMRKRLHAATAEYQAALAEDLETERVDALEDALLELLEEAEEAAEDARDGP